MKLFAHRGVMANYPENTISAFKEALRTGADGIETDVHMTKDGHLLLIHDETLNRTTNCSGRIGEMTWREVMKAQIKVSSHLDEHVPSLDELLDLLIGEKVQLNLEIKTDVERYPGIEKRLIETLKNNAFPSENIIFSSFNHETLSRLRDIDDSYEYAALLAQPLHQLKSYLNRLGATAVHPSIRTLTDEEVTHLQENGIKVRPYTVKTSESLERFNRLDVDGVFVNDIEWARTVLTP